MTTCYGDLDLYGKDDITELPEGLKVKGHLNLAGTQITELPDDLKVGETIFMPDGTKFEKFNENKSLNVAFTVNSDDNYFYVSTEDGLNCKYSKNKYSLQSAIEKYIHNYVF